MIRYLGLKADDEALGSTLEPGIYGELGKRLKEQGFYDTIIIKNLTKIRCNDGSANVITKEQKQEELLLRVSGFRLLYDDFMTKCLQCSKLL